MLAGHVGANHGADDHPRFNNIQDLSHALVWIILAHHVSSMLMQCFVGTAIEKGTMRLGTLVDIKGNQSFTWRHWGCITPKLMKNLTEKIGEPTDLDGYDDLKPEDQAKITKAFQEGQVDPADVPESAKKADGEDGEDDEEGGSKKRKRKAPAPKKKVGQFWRDVRTLAQCGIPERG